MRLFINLDNLCLTFLVGMQFIFTYLPFDFGVQCYLFISYDEYISESQSGVKLEHWLEMGQCLSSIFCTSFSPTTSE